MHALYDRRGGIMKRYIAIDLEVMKQHNLTMLEWALCENIQFLSNNEKNTCNCSKKSLAEHLGVSERHLFRMINSLVEKNLLKKMPKNGLRITPKWIEILSENGGDKMSDSDKMSVTKCPIDSDKMSDESVTKCPTLPIKKEIKERIREREGEIFFEDEKLNTLFLEYLSLRKKMKLSNSQTVINRLKNKLAHFIQMGLSPHEALESAITSQWKDLYPPKSQNSTFSPIVEKGLGAVNEFLSGGE